MIEWGVTLSDWLFNAIESNEVLTLSHDYFRLKKSLERRLYEVARKHCGAKYEWRIGLDLLLKKCGSSSPKRNFKSMLKQIGEHDYLPDYYVNVIDDTVVFTNRGHNPTQDTAGTNHSLLPQLMTSTYDKFRKNHPGYDPYYVEQEWRIWATGKEQPKSADAAFLAFTKVYAERQAG